MKIEFTAEFMKEWISFPNTDGTRTIYGEVRSSKAVDGLPPGVDPRRMKVRVKGRSDCLTPGLTYRFYGQWLQHKEHGWQFSVFTHTFDTPIDRRGVIAYLKTAPFIGQAIAERIWDEFGQDSLWMMRRHPEECAKKIRVLHSVEARHASEFLNKHSTVERVRADLMGLFDGNGIPLRAVDPCIEKWGNQAAVLVKQNPYLLLKLNRIGVGWAKAHAFYKAMGRPLKLKCFVFCLEHALSEISNTWISELHAKDILDAFSTSNNFDRVLKLGTKVGVLDSRRDSDGKLWIAKASHAADERSIAQNIHRLLGAGDSEFKIKKGDLSVHQHAELKKALKKKVGVLQGSPGTGKTYSLAHLVKQLIPAVGLNQIAIITPTGKAAARANQMLANANIRNIEAKTIHRFLKPDGDFQQDGWRFAHGVDNWVTEKFVICEEASMNGVEITARLLEALPDGCRLLLVGDTDQLPPIAHGAVLRDIIQSEEVGVGTLTLIHRNSGRIVKACRDLRVEGVLRPNEGPIDYSQGENFAFMQEYGIRRIMRMESFYDSMIVQKKVDVIGDILVITAMNEKSPVSRAILNRVLQEKLNPNGYKDKKGYFRVGDKVICRRNEVYKALDGSGKPTSNQVMVANGEMGRIRSIDRKSETMTIDLLGFEVRSYSSGVNCQFELAYAITCHLAQGAEIPYVVTMVDDSPAACRFMSREWFTTAISRAGTLQIMIGSREAAEACCRKTVLGNRKTFLAEEIRDGAIDA